MAITEPALNSIDCHFAALMQRLALRQSAELELAAKLVSRFRADGHVCVPLRDLSTTQMSLVGVSEPLPNRVNWTKKLRASGVVGEPGEFKPLILDAKDRLYLQRYWKYENAVADGLRARASRRRNDFSYSILKKQLARLFPEKSDLQKLAAFCAAVSGLCLISGAPGTGKTRTIISICALLILLNQNRELKFALAAPTGKAAARLKESIAQAKQSFQVPGEVESKLPTEASTIQRLLGAIGDSPCFRHDAQHPLSADVIIIDEASMIDLALLAKLLDAIRPDARVILVGDKDQLASVEAGSVFRDICGPEFGIPVSSNLAGAFRECTGEVLSDSVPSRAPIHDIIVELRRNYRFAGQEAIVELSTAVNRGNVSETIKIFKRGGSVRWRPTPSVQSLPRELRATVVTRFASLATAKDPNVALAQLSEFALLCALRRGPFGAETVNAVIERLLTEEGVGERVGEYRHGQPVMILQNDYHVGLFNGDIGIVLLDAASGGALRAFFICEDGRMRGFAPARLPPHELAFAFTVHKAQGSEFREVVVILPELDAPILTRELMYTAVSRARENVEVWANEAVLKQAITRTAHRSSGLRDALWYDVGGK